MSKDQIINEILKKALLTEEEKKINYNRKRIKSAVKDLQTAINIIKRNVDQDKKRHMYTIMSQATDITVVASEIEDYTSQIVPLLQKH